MPLGDLLARILARPARRVVDGPVRSLVDEALADRSVPSPTELATLRADLQDRQAAVDALAQRVDGLGSLVQELETELADTRRALREAKANPTPKPPARPLGAPCPIEGCTEATDAVFCTTHATAWAQGALTGVVGPEGQVSHGDRALRVQQALAGRPVVVSGTKRLTVKVDGQRVSFRAAASPPEEAPR